MNKFFSPTRFAAAVILALTCVFGLAACEDESDVVGGIGDQSSCEGAKCDSISDSDESSATGAGPVGELEPVSAIVVANPDGFGATLDLHNKIAENLPPEIKLVAIRSPSAPGDAPSGAIAIEADIDSPWARDFAPIFVRNGEGKLEAVDFKYGYEGADKLAGELATKLGVPSVSSPLVVEGGNILTDRGRLFITTKVLAANATMTKEQVEAELKRALRVEQVEFMPRLPDEATGHIDIFAKLIAPGTMLIADTAHPEQKKTLTEVAKRFTDLGYKVIRVMNLAIPPSDPDLTSWGPTLTYANSLIVQGIAFVPQYDSELYQMLAGNKPAKSDKAALKVYESAGLKAVGVPAASLISFNGSVHCMTNSIPREVDLSKLTQE